MGKLRVDIIALANYADYSKDGKLSINGIFDEIYAEKYPSSFVRGFLVLTISGEPNSQSVLKVVCQSPRNKTVLEKDISMPFGSNGKGNFIVELLALPLPEAGEYTIFIKDKTTEIAFTKFNVSAAKKVDEQRRGQGNSPNRAN